MDLKKFLPSKDQENQELFWSVIIEPGWIQAGIWKIYGDKAQIMSSGVPFVWASDEDLVTSADSALSVNVQDFPEDVDEPSKTVFGVVSSWVANGEIKAERLGQIKKICTDLSLTPVGFVVMPEAIAHLIKSEEGTPLNGLVLGVYKETIELSFFKLGNLLGTTQVARSVSLIDDVVEGLSRFPDSTDGLPSRVLLYDGKESETEDARQTLLKANWEDFDKLRFLHTPKIEIVDIKRKMFAVSLAGASEIDNVVGIISTKDTQESEETDDQRAMEPNDGAEDDNGGDELSAADAGFVLEKDIASQDKEIHASKPDQLNEAGTTEFKPPNTSPSVMEGQVQPSDAVDNLRRPQEAAFKNIHRPKFTFPKLPAISQLLTKLKLLSLGKAKAEAKAGGSSAKKVFIMGAVSFVILLVAGFAFWWFYPKATVVVYVSPKKLEERVDVTIDPNAGSANFSEKIIPGNVVENSVSGEKTKSTTGTKTVGDKATGEVTLYRVGPALSLEESTTIYGPDNLQFSLDDAIEIASGSAGTPGTTKAKVTAGDIGAEYNLASNATFTVGNYSSSDIEAKNESAFSGGTSREVSAISEEDQEDLLSDLETELKGKAIEDFMNKISGDVLFIEESLTTETTSETFSGEVGDEATTLKLSLELTTSGLEVSKTELFNFSQELLKEKIPQGFVMRSEQVKTDFGSVSKVDLKYQFSVGVEANLLPAVDPAEVAAKIVGKYPLLAEEYLTKEIPGFARAEITIKPALPGKLKTLPRVVKNIEVEIASER